MGNLGSDASPNDPKMKITILHLSDIHFRLQDNPILDKAESIILCIQEALRASEGLIIAISGDIAFSGLKKEYEIAESFVHQLRGTAVKTAPRCEVYISLAPGNHDCDFSRETQVRKIILESIISGQDTSATDPDIIKQLTSIQDDYFEFAARLTNVVPTVAQERVRHSRKLTIKGKTIHLNTYNTAWLSRLKERQATLRLPTAFLLPYEACDLALTLLHHPYNWLSADSARAFQKHLEHSSDIILTGHEHDPLVYEKLLTSGDRPRYSEGAALQEGGKLPPSGFNTLLVDLENKQELRTQYSWSKDEKSYLKQQESGWAPIIRVQEERTRSFENNQDFLNYLSDAGAAFTHPSARTLTLRDLFIYPDVDDRP
ncbi:MAG TPA: metallophosphoesterase [Myxococcaceae bacterium]